MVVRGAPLIGFTAIYGICLWSKTTDDLSLEGCKKACDYLVEARPTAVNLEYELKRILVDLETSADIFENRENSVNWFKQRAEEAISQLENDNMEMARSAEAALDRVCPGIKKLKLMTLCNTGYLACGPIGTALGVISYLHQKDRIQEVFAFETRPYLQGARLTAYELSKQNIQYRLVVEGAMASVIESEKPHAIFVGADRISENGDTANKIGTATLSIIAKHFDVPFFVVAPSSSFDLLSKSGHDIEIEHRSEEEVLSVLDQRIAPKDAKAINPSFDVTVAAHIKSIFCEKGEITPVNKENLTHVISRRRGENA
jgi:methylthioribose-1-phosphate isomerase